jgi:mRNA interferase MazF
MASLSTPMIKDKIVLIPFPFDDLTTTKVRPALCLTNSISPHNHVVVAFITSKIPGEILESDMVIDSRAKNFAETGLSVTSVLRLHRLMTVSISIIKRQLGVLPVSQREEVSAKLLELFELK